MDQFQRVCMTVGMGQNGFMQPLESSSANIEDLPFACQVIVVSWHDGGKWISTGNGQELPAVPDWHRCVGAARSCRMFYEGRG